MAPKYVLHYFDIRGRAEVSRWMFEIAGVEYTDRRYTREEWQRFKCETPFGVMPVLEIDDFMLGQTSAIELYLANEFGLYGSNNKEKAEIEMIELCLGDILMPLFEGWVYKQELKERRLHEFATVNYPKMLAFLAKMMGDKDYLVGNRLSVADLNVVRFLTEIAPATGVVPMPSALNYPKLADMCHRVTSMPQIAAWIERRPKALY